MAQENEKTTVAIQMTDEQKKIFKSLMGDIVESLIFELFRNSVVATYGNDANKFIFAYLDQWIGAIKQIYIKVQKMNEHEFDIAAGAFKNVMYEQLKISDIVQAPKIILPNTNIN